MLFCQFFSREFYFRFLLSVGIVVGLLIYEFINTKIKASIHVGVAVALLWELVYYMWQYFILTAWIVPVVAWSRMILKRHTKL
jgi:hypothetical protein